MIKGNKTLIGNRFKILFVHYCFSILMFLPIKLEVPEDFSQYTSLYAKPKKGQQIGMASSHMLLINITEYKIKLLFT